MPSNKNQYMHAIFPIVANYKNPHLTTPFINYLMNSCWALLHRKIKTLLLICVLLFIRADNRYGRQDLLLNSRRFIKDSHSRKLIKCRFRLHPQPVEATCVGSGMNSSEIFRILQCMRGTLQLGEKQYI